MGARFVLLLSRLLTLDSISSGDSLGTDPSQQKQTYDEAVGRHPNSFLSLQHEVYGKRRIVTCHGGEGFANLKL